jgi:hypothetical protein
LRVGVCLNSDSVNRLEALTHDFTRQIRIEFAQEITRDPKTFKKSLLRLIGRQLPPRRGRPNDPQIDAAMRMLDQGKSVKEILRLQIRGFDEMDTYGRLLVEKGLRTAITRRRKHIRSIPPQD